MTARRAILLAAMTAVICVNVAVPATAQIYLEARPANGSAAK
jgi:hypothetical protein